MSKIANFETAPIEWDPSNAATCQIEFTQRERVSHSNIGERGLDMDKTHVARRNSNISEFVQNQYL